MITCGERYVPYLNDGGSFQGTRLLYALHGIYFLQIAHKLSFTNLANFSNYFLSQRSKIKTAFLPSQAQLVNAVLDL